MTQPSHPTCGCACHTGGPYRPACDTHGGCGHLHTAYDEARPRCRDAVCVTDDPGLCTACTAKAAVWVAELPRLWVLLHLRMGRGQATGERVSGTGEAPIPARVDVLSFVGPTYPGDRLDLPGDDRERARLAAMQVGDIPLLGRLEATVERVCAELHLTTPRPSQVPARSVTWPYGPPSLAQVEAYRRWREQSWPHRQAAATLAFLRRWHTWICGHDWAGDYAVELREVWTTAMTLVGEWQPRPESVNGVACPYADCDAMTLYRHLGKDGRYCHADEGGCGRWISDDDFDRWVKSSAHFAREAV